MVQGRGLAVGALEEDSSLDRPGGVLDALIAEALGPACRGADVEEELVASVGLGLGVGGIG